MEMSAKRHTYHLKKTSTKLNFRRNSAPRKFLAVFEVADTTLMRLRSELLRKRIRKFCSKEPTRLVFVIKWFSSRVHIFSVIVNFFILWPYFAQKWKCCVLKNFTGFDFCCCWLICDKIGFKETAFHHLGHFLDKQFSNETTWVLVDSYTTANFLKVHSILCWEIITSGLIISLSLSIYLTLKMFSSKSQLNINFLLQTSKALNFWLSEKKTGKNRRTISQKPIFPEFLRFELIDLIQTRNNFIEQAQALAGLGFF